MCEETSYDYMQMEYRQIRPVVFVFILVSIRIHFFCVFVLEYFSYLKKSEYSYSAEMSFSKKKKLNYE